VKYIFPGTRFTTETVSLTWYNGNARPPEEIVALAGRRLAMPKEKFNNAIHLDGQGSIVVGTEGILYSQYDTGDTPILMPAEKFKDFKMPDEKNSNHYLEFVEAVRGNGATSAPFSYAGPLTEMVLLGCLATRFPKTDLKWDTKGLKVTNKDEANAFVRRAPRPGFETAGLDK